MSAVFSAPDRNIRKKGSSDSDFSHVGYPAWNECSAMPNTRYPYRLSTARATTNARIIRFVLIMSPPREFVGGARVLPLRGRGTSWADSTLLGAPGARSKLQIPCRARRICAYLCSSAVTSSGLPYGYQDHHRAISHQDRRGHPADDARGTPAAVGGGRLQPVSRPGRGHPDRPAHRLGHLRDVHRAVGGDDARRRI